MDLTGVMDMDLIILQALPLKEIRNVCQSNHYCHQLCVKF